MRTPVRIRQVLELFLHPCLLEQARRERIFMNGVVLQGGADLMAHNTTEVVSSLFF
jgi:hypothetical protein